MAFSPILKVAPENYYERGNIVGVNGCIGMLTNLGHRGRNTKIRHVFFVFDIKFMFLHFFSISSDVCALQAREYA